VRAFAECGIALIASRAAQSASFCFGIAKYARTNPDHHMLHQIRTLISG
jgi:hypothetical protein